MAELSVTQLDLFKSVFVSLSLGIVAVDRLGNVIFVNNAATNIIGVGTAAIALEHWTEHYGVFLPDASTPYPADQSPLVRAMAGEEQSNLEVFIQNTLGRVRAIWCSLDFRPLRDGKDEIVGAVLLVQDITQRKKLADEVERSNTALQQFATVAAHDLQEPLRSIAGFADMLAQFQTGLLDERSARCLKKIKDGIVRMQTLINDLLAFSRIQTKPQSFKLTDCNELVRSCIKGLNASIKKDGSTIEVDQLPTLMADSSQLLQLFQNLIGNAVKFCAEDRAPVVHIAAKKQGAFWLFSVEDNGIGIAPEFAERIFGVFQRLHNKSAYSGNGIGLAICQMIVDRHGGRIWVEPKGAEGCIFYFTLPAEMEKN